jgi:hypothetical protein
MKLELTYLSDSCVLGVTVSGPSQTRDENDRLAKKKKTFMSVGSPITTARSGTTAEYLHHVG